ncbi:hypothetical protein BGZ99_001032 [Dissophora globulifera]|uniref:PAS domain-containing protein n=1 Tax=Dissophora globulifera TaxID=979702 RepID=A0A9P6RP97_9FUNG|nr:hypothetical protein BGZ99_001032 [Dissophora globulifera]
MFQYGNGNFISFNDLSPEARILWTSPSIYDILGYTPDELVGMPAYDIINADDIAPTRVGHKENMLNDLVASQMTVRFIAKDGRFVPCVVVVSLCYDFLLNCATVVNPNLNTYKQLRTHSAAMNRLVGSRKEEFERIKRHHEAFATNTWDTHVMEPELRVCMILNRFSRNLIIMYASSACERVFDIDPDHIVGKPLLLFIRADDLASFVEQMDMIKASTAVAYMRFWFQSPKLRQEIPCEVMLFGAADGIVAVIRRCRPFVRKRFIASGVHYQTTSTAAATMNANMFKNRSQSSSWTSASSASLNSVSSAASFLSISPLVPQQDRRHIMAADDSNKVSSPPGDVPMSRISRIQILDLDENSNNNSNKSRGAHDIRSKARRLVIPKDDPLLVKDALDLPDGFGVKMYNVQDYVEEQDDDDDSSDEIDNYGDDDGSRVNARQESDINMNVDIN